MTESSESEVLAQELSSVSDKLAALETRVREVEAVIGRLEGGTRLEVLTVRRSDAGNVAA
jgi:hypothetical protein